MKTKRDNTPKKNNFIDVIKRMIFNLREHKQEEYLINTPPIMKKYSDIELMKLINISNKLKTANEGNSLNGIVSNGISEEEAKKILQWIVQTTRDGLDKDLKKSGKDILTWDLCGACGLSQGISVITMQDLGLEPYACNVRKVIGEGAHAFAAVEIPIKENEVTQKRIYLIDATYKQFFLTNKFTNSKGDFISDKKYKGKVASTPGYWLLQMDKGRALAEEMLSNGFVELTEENAKLYGDAFILSNNERKHRTRVPRGNDLKTGISGKQYILNITNPQLQEEIDYSRQELAEWGIETRLPNVKQETNRSNNNRQNFVSLKEYQERIGQNEYYNSR